MIRNQAGGFALATTCCSFLDLTSSITFGIPLLEALLICIPQNEDCLRLVKLPKQWHKILFCSIGGLKTGNSVIMVG